MSGILDELGLAETDLAALMGDTPERPLRDRHGVLDDLGMREADLAALAHDAPERSPYQEGLDAELREEAREAAEPTMGQLMREAARWTAAGRPSAREEGRLSDSQRTASGGPRQRQIVGWVQALRDTERRGGPVPWEQVRAILAEARYGAEEIEAAARSVVVREEAAHRAYTGEPSEEELADREAAFDEAWGDDGEGLIEELAEGLRGG